MRYFIILIFFYTTCSPGQNSNSSNKMPINKETKRLKLKLKKWEKEYSNLESEYNELIKKVKKLGDLSRKLALGYSQISRFELAAREIHKTIQNKSFPAKYQNYQKAIKFYQKAFLFSKVDEDLLYQASLIYANASMAFNWDKAPLKIALALLDGLIKKNKSNSNYWYQRGILKYKGLHNNYEAIRDLQKASFLSPNEAPPLEALGQLYYVSGKNVQALYYYEKALSIIERYLTSNGIDKKKSKSYNNISIIVDTIRKQLK